MAEQLGLHFPWDGKKIKETIHIGIYGAINGLNSGINISREHKDAMKRFHQNVRSLASLTNPPREIFIPLWFCNTKDSLNKRKRDH